MLHKLPIDLGHSILRNCETSRKSQNWVYSLLPILPSRYKNLVKVLESWKKSAVESSIDLVISLKHFVRACQSDSQNAK